MAYIYVNHRLMDFYHLWYSVLKTRLLSEFEVSEDRNVKILLENLELADRSPSIFLRIMRELNKSHVNDDFWKNTWLRRLPVSVQTILSVSSEGLDKLVDMGDKIFDCKQVGVNSLDSRESEQA